MKMIMPIARPATVSVSQVEVARRRPGGSASAATQQRHERRSATSRCLGRRAGDVGGAAASAHWCAASDRPSSACCNASSAGELGHRAAVHDAAVVHHRDACRRARCAKLKFCSTSRIVVAARFSSRSAAIRLLMIAGARPLLGSSISSSSRGSTMARAIAEHLLLPARQLAGRMVPELLQRREEAEQPFEPGAVDLLGVRAPRAASSMFSRTVRSAKMPMFSGT